MTVAGPQFASSASPSPEKSLAASIMQGDVPALASAFKEWRKSGILPVHDIVSEIIEPLGFEARHQRILQAAADMAAEPNNNPFHGNRHFMEVFATAALLGQHALKENRIERKDFALLLTAALIHDYGHDGGVNGPVQFRLESLAVDKSKARLGAAGATKGELAIIRDFVLTTDVSKNFADPGAHSPADTVKRYNFTRDAQDLHPALKGLHKSGLADVALMLQDADVGSSLIDPQLCRQSGEYLAAEQKRAFDPQSQLFFLNTICRRHMFSESGHKLIQPALNRVLEEARINPGPACQYG